MGCRSAGVVVGFGIRISGNWPLDNVVQAATLRTGKATHMKTILLITIVLSLVLTATVQGELPPLISRDILFGNPERTSPALSPDGKRLAWLAPDTNNVLQVWVKTVGKDDDKIITADKKRGIRQYFWAKDNRNLLYL